MVTWWHSPRGWCLPAGSHQRPWAHAALALPLLHPNRVPAIAVPKEPFQSQQVAELQGSVPETTQSRLCERLYTYKHCCWVSKGTFEPSKRVLHNF